MATFSDSTGEKMTDEKLSATINELKTVLQRFENGEEGWQDHDKRASLQTALFNHDAYAYQEWLKDKNMDLAVIFGVQQ